MQFDSWLPQHSMIYWTSGSGIKSCTHEKGEGVKMKIICIITSNNKNNNKGKKLTNEIKGVGLPVSL